MSYQEKMLDYDAPAKLLDDKIILVTGAGSGIGRTAALTFAKYGATVVLVGRTLAKLEDIYDEIEISGYPQAAIFPINFESAGEADYQAMYEAIEEEFGRLDGLLHNAAELGPRTPLANYKAELWQKVMQVNVNAPFLLSKAMQPLLKQAASASVVFTGSSVGIKGRAYWGGYAVSKAAIENLMEVLADELEDTSKVRVNSINPGATRTNMRAAAYPAEDPQTVISAETLMNQYLFLMGEDSQGISGVQFNAQEKKV